MSTGFRTFTAALTKEREDESLIIISCSANGQTTPTFTLLPVELRYPVV